MLVKTMPKAISNSWNILKEVIRGNSMPLLKLDNEGLNSIFERLLSGRITCWYGCDDGKVHTVVLTEILIEPGSQTKNLMILTVSLIEKVDAAEYVSMMETLQTYARGLGCAKVYCYSSNEKITKLFETYGADASYKLIKFEL